MVDQSLFKGKEEALEIREESKKRKKGIFIKKWWKGKS
jgi:hypothetical protein